MPAPSEKLTNVFVYGTLKRNQPNHHWFWQPNKGTARFVSTGCTITKFPLFVGSQYNVPFLLNKPGIGNCIFGEIYEVDEIMLANLDVLEDFPVLYDRQRHEITMDDR